ncbi:MAG: PssE/Cps14G family polysaccharide biosynthesis glycosyltransferase [Bacilli bacterium]|nr:PssE/Cps14G family polysaccharide biosynthesis glycosyltransferase [Bacilli bacterium]
MILITLGTQDKQFTRLLDMVQKEIDKGNINDKVIVQAGHTKYDSKDMEIFDLIDREKFSELISKCDILITHGGVGSIITGLQNNKKVIVAPRLAKYDEHMNDHQIQITDNFSKAGYILPLYECDDLGEVLKKVKNFTPKKFKSNTEHMIKIISDYIDKN